MSDELTTILSSQCVFLHLTSKKRRQVIEELAELAAGCSGIEEHRSLAKELWKREKLSTTAIGHGVAVPHRLTPLVDRTVVIIGRTDHGISFEAVDNEPIRLLIMVLGPEGAHSRHLKLLSRLARLLSSAEFRRELLEATEPEEVVAAFRKREFKNAAGGAT